MEVLATSMLMTGKKKEEELEWVLYIWYLVTLKDEDQTKALLDSKSKVNVMNLAFASEIGLKIWKTNVGAQKIDGTTLKSYEMIVSTFSLLDKDNRERFFEESFLLADIKLDKVLGIPFLTMSNADIDFQAKRISNHQTSWVDKEERVCSCSS